MTAPRMSLIIPAWNEQAYLPRLLDTVDAARACYHGGPDAVEVIVADNDSTDRTAEIARERGCHVAYVERRRIACARNGGAAMARGEILCFVDADFRIHPETFNAIDDAMRTGRYVGGATGMRVERMSLGIASTLFAILPLLWLTGLDAGVWFTERRAYDEVGGYNEELPVSEDVRFLWAIQRAGRRRRPRQRLVRLSSWRSFWRTLTPPPAQVAESIEVCGVRAVLSTRKFDKHGDWHFLLGLLSLPVLVLRGRLGKYIRQYWYEDER